MEVVGNYISLSRCQAECHRLEAKTKCHVVYDHVISSGNRLIFLEQASHDDGVSAKILKKGDFAVNLTNVSVPSNLDETKLLAAVREQLKVYNDCYLSYLHGRPTIRISLEYGSIFVANAHGWVLGTTVQKVEEELSRKSFGRNRKRKKPTMELKFVDLQKGQDVVTKLLSLGISNTELSTKEMFYIVELKVNNNHKLKVVIDENCKFKSYQFEPFKWLDARLKSRRPVGSRSGDIDLRLTLASRRDLESTEEYESLPIYETFGKNPILSLNAQGKVEVSKEYRRKAIQILSVDSEVYTLYYNDNVIFVEVNKVKKYDAKRPMRFPDRQYTTVKPFVDIGVNIDPNTTEIEKLVIDVLHVGKLLKP